MDLTFRAALCGLAIVFTVGCSSGSSSPITYADAGVIDLRGREGPAVAQDDSGGNGAGSDAGKPAPVSGEGSVSLFKGKAALLANGAPCANEGGATTDRWCAFTSPSTISLDGVDLFVINVSRAAAGTAIACGGATVDPNCLRLTAGFAEDATGGGPPAAGFQGDTLIYFDKTGAGFGWRPGMSNGRFLGVGALHDCIASAKGASLLCLRDLTVQPVPGVIQSELLAGRPDGAATPALSSVATAVTANANVDAATVGFRVGFGPNGDDVAWSSREQMGGPEVLKTQKVGDDSTRVTVASDVSRWAISPDGARWYWLSQYNYDVIGMPAGILQMAPFPGGGTPTILLRDVGSFRVTRAGAIVAQTQVTGFRGTMRSIVDPANAPASVVTLDTGVVGVASVGAQGHVAYVKQFNILGLSDLLVAKVDGTGARCALVTQAEASPSVVFLPSGGQLLWARVTNLDAPFDTPFTLRLTLTRLADCSATTLAADAPAFGAASDQSVVFEDGYDGEDGTLRIAFLNLAGTAPPALIQTRINGFVPLPAVGGAVLFSVAANSVSDGLYLYLPTPPPTAPDGGATTADGGATGAPDAMSN